MSTITLTDLTKHYDSIAAVDGIDLDVLDEEFLVVVGPSGCGKSTTLRLIAGLEDATAGTIRIGGTDVTDSPPEDRDIAMVFQNYALYPHMTAAENMTFGMQSVTDYSSAEIEDRVADAAATLGITELLSRTPDALSGGERQRVAIGRALVREPSVFLLDEPLSNLDAKLRVHMRAELSKLHRELDTTTVYVTHDQTEAMTLGDRVAVLNDGTVQQVAPPQQLYDFPANQFVAGFIGEPAMNLVPVRVRDRPRGLVADHEGFAHPLPDGGSNSALVDRRLTFGVRPEDVLLAGRSATGHEESFEARVTVREPLGEQLLLHCTIGDDELQVKVQPRRDVSTGDTIRLCFDQQRLHLFDPETGDAIYHAASEDQPAKPTPSQ